MRKTLVVLSIAIVATIAGFMPKAVPLVAQDNAGAIGSDANAKKISSLTVRSSKWVIGFGFDGSGHLGWANGPHEITLFSEETFDTKAIVARIKDRFTSSRPVCRPIEDRYFAWLVIEGQGAEVWARDPAVLASIFELGRQASRHGLELGKSKVAEAWRRYPPTPLSKPWDAPVDPVPESGLTIPLPQPLPSVENKPDADAGRIVLKLRSALYAYVGADGSVAFGGVGDRLAWLPPATLKTDAAVAWIRSHSGPGRSEARYGMRVEASTVQADGSAEALGPTDPQAAGEFFELLRIAYQVHGYRYPPIERDWQHSTPIAAPAWDYPLRWTPLAEKLLDPALRPAVERLAKDRPPPELVWISYDNATFAIWSNGGGMLRCLDFESRDDSRPLFEVARADFPPGTFSVDPSKWKDRLAEPEFRNQIEAINLWFASPNPAKPGEWEYLLPREEKLNYEIFELFRQACHRHKPKEFDRIAAHWKKSPPWKGAKPWDAPIGDK